jgi:hypothetical protein
LVRSPNKCPTTCDSGVATGVLRASGLERVNDDEEAMLLALVPTVAASGLLRWSLSLSVVALPRQPRSS